MSCRQRHTKGQKDLANAEYMSILDYLLRIEKPTAGHTMKTFNSVSVSALVSTTVAMPALGLSEYPFDK